MDTSAEEGISTPGPGRATRAAAVLLTVVGALVSCYFTLFPFNFILRRSSLGAVFSAFTITTGFPLAPRELPANLLLFLPLGAGLASWMAQHGTPRGRAVLLTGVVAAMLSTCIEITQSAWLLRDPSLDDIVGNTLGGVIGAWGVARLLAPGTGIHRWLSTRRWGALTLIVAVLWTALGIGGLIRSAGDTRLGGWDAAYPLMIGNEATGDVPWRGAIRYLGIADRTLSPSELNGVLAGRELGDRAGRDVVLEQHFSGEREVPAGWAARGADAAAATTPTPSASGSGVALSNAFWLIRPDARAVVERVMDAQSFTVVVEARSDSVAQSGPARLVTISVDTLHRDLAVTQDGADLVVRIRSEFSGKNGRFPEFVYPGVFRAPGWHRIVVGYDVGGLTVAVDDPSRIRRLGFGPATVPAVEWFPDRVQRIQLSGASAPLIAAFVALSTYGPLAVWLGAFGPRRRVLAAVLAATTVVVVHLVLTTALSTAGWHPAWVATVAVGAAAVCLVVRVQVSGLRPRRVGAGR